MQERDSRERDERQRPGSRREQAGDPPRAEHRIAELDESLTIVRRIRKTLHVVRPPTRGPDRALRQQVDAVRHTKRSLAFRKGPVAIVQPQSCRIGVSGPLAGQWLGAIEAVRDLDGLHAHADSGGLSAIRKRFYRRSSGCRTRQLEDARRELRS